MPSENHIDGIISALTALVADKKALRATLSDLTIDQLRDLADASRYLHAEAEARLR
jgi:hypothetical protein